MSIAYYIYLWKIGTYLEKQHNPDAIIIPKKLFDITKYTINIYISLSVLKIVL